ncbi:phosphopantetheine-binding protein [Nonomuraea sp. NPDC050663]|uniref:phosphopantetheine-binding protein n=1 Tax=Nonomuraea sp. NPDC050663 TaxID=3364370 RepID=UPI00179C4A0B|nr:acyl carrier protein [Thermoactinospora sp.]
MRTSNDERTALREFLEPRLPSTGWSDDEDLFDAGLVDSFMAMEIVTFIEGHLGTAVPDEEIDIANFRTIDAIAALMERLG